MKKKKEPFIENTIETIGLAKKFIQLVNPLFNQVLDENWKYVFYFYLKPNELLDQPKKMATHSSTLAWRIPWTEEPGGL